VCGSNSQISIVKKLEETQGEGKFARVGAASQIPIFDITKRYLPIENTYNCFEPISGSSIRIPMKFLQGEDLEEFISRPAPLYMEFGEPLHREILYAGVKATSRNVWKSLLKMDSELIMNVQDPILWKRALEATENVLEPVLKCDWDPMPEFVETTSATLPFSLMGFRKKREVLCEPAFYSEYVQEPFDKPCLWRASAKYEFLSIREIVEEDKIRTFIIPPLHLLYWQKSFGSGDKKMKEIYPGDIRYGYSFQYGGFDKLIRAHGNGSFEETMKRLFFEVDVSGWDRLIPLLRQAWEMRKKFLRYPKTLEVFIDWVIEQTVRSFVVLPNGDIIRRKCGNNSGSGTTTSDNCIMHQMLTNYLREKLNYYHGISQEDLRADIYGDDLLSSIKVDAETEDLMLRILKDLLRNMYKEFNLTVKESAFHIQKGPVGMHFLGATCQVIEDRFVPAYDSERIYSAFVSEIDKHGSDDELSKAYALMHLSWYDEELFENIREFIQKILAEKEIHGPFIDALRTTGVPYRSRVIQEFWLGVEGAYSYPAPSLQ